MSEIYILRENSLRQWFNDKGDYTHNLNYNLNEDSIVMDLGGYLGVWTQQIIDKYNPNVYIVEPIPTFYNHLVEKFSNNNKVKLLNVGISNSDKHDIIYECGDASSTFFNNGVPINVVFKKIEHIFNYFNILKIDLLQVNIEGYEYDLLEYMIDNNMLNNIKNIQIQYHLGVIDCENRRNNIQKKLYSINFNKKFDYPFVWESWYNIQQS